MKSPMRSVHKRSSFSGPLSNAHELQADRREFTAHPVVSFSESVMRIESSFLNREDRRGQTRPFEIYPRMWIPFTELIRFSGFQ